MPNPAAWVSTTQVALQIRGRRGRRWSRWRRCRGDGAGAICGAGAAAEPTRPAVRVVRLPAVSAAGGGGGAGLGAGGGGGANATCQVRVVRRPAVQRPAAVAALVVRGRWRRRSQRDLRCGWCGGRRWRCSGRRRWRRWCWGRWRRREPTRPAVRAARRQAVAVQRPAAVVALVLGPVAAEEPTRPGVLEALAVRALAPQRWPSL